MVALPVHPRRVLRALRRFLGLPPARRDRLVGTDRGLLRQAVPRSSGDGGRRLPQEPFTRSVRQTALPMVRCALVRSFRPAEERLRSGSAGNLDAETPVAGNALRPRFAGSRVFSRRLGRSGRAVCDVQSGRSAGTPRSLRHGPLQYPARRSAGAAHRPLRSRRLYRPASPGLCHPNGIGQQPAHPRAGRTLAGPAVAEGPGMDVLVRRPARDPIHRLRLREPGPFQEPAELRTAPRARYDHRIRERAGAVRLHRRGHHRRVQFIALGGAGRGRESGARHPAISLSAPRRGLRCL